MPTPVAMDIYREDELVDSRTFERDIIKIGRLSSAHLRLEDEQVSRIHAVVEVDPAGDVSIIDMGSAVGTLVNGERVNKGPLADGDEIRVGQTRIVVRLDGRRSEVAAAVAAPAELPAEPAPSEPPAAPPAAPAPEAPTQAAPAEVPVVTGDAPAAPTAAPDAPEAVAPPPDLAADGAAPEEEAAPAPDDRIFEPGFGRPLPPEPERFDLRGFVEGPAGGGTAPSTDHRAIELRFMWGQILLNVAHYERPKRITIGESRKSDFFLHADDFPVNEFPLVRYDGDYQLAFTDKMQGLVRLGNETFTLAELVRSRKAVSDPQLDGAWVVSLPADARAALEFGGVTVAVRFVPPPRRIATPWAEQIDYGFLNLLILALFLHLAFLITAHNFPYDTDLIADDLFKSPNRFAKFLLKPPEPVQNERLERLLAGLKKDDPGEAAARHEGEEGKMGRKNAPDRKTRSAPKAIDINAKDIIANNGVFRMLQEGGSAGISTVFGKGGLGGDINGALGGLVGSTVGDAQGFGGLGLKGTGPGGGGLSGSTIGVGGIGTKGRGGGLGGYGTGVGGLGKKRDSDISISTGEPVVMGSLDRELIRRVIQSHRDQIRYCYERQLQSKPDLFGKITVKFVISGAGAVTSAKIDGTTMNDAGVEQCLVSRVRTWQFPKPKGGGIVIVTYPFVFKHGE